MIHLVYLVVQTSILAIQMVQLISKLIQIKEAVLFGVGKLRSQMENFLVQLCNLGLVLVIVGVRLIDTELIATDFDLPLGCIDMVAWHAL